MTRPVDIKDLVAMLTHQLDALLQQLCPGGHIESGDYVVLNPIREDRHPGSFRICVAGAKRGIWSEFATGDKGDALDLVAYLGQIDKKDAVAWAKRWLGLEDATPQQLQIRKREAAAAQRQAQARAQEQRERRRRQAQRLYLSAQPIAGTPAERYLRDERGIDLARLPRMPRSLVYHPELYSVETQTAWPGMVAAVVGPQGQFLAVHRTFLQVHRNGRVTKAPLRDAKRTLGLYQGGCVRLWKGAANKSLFQVPEGSAVTISEGIEDGLTCAVADPSRMVLCAVSLGAMAELVLPDQVSAVHIAQQNDGANKKAAADLTRAIDHFFKAGKRVFVFAPPKGVKDVNDLLRQSGREEGVA